jgi:type I restriction enzyme S subunit
MSWNQNIKRIVDVCEVIAGQSPEGKYYNKVGEGLPFYQGKKEFRDKQLGEPTTWTTKTTKEAFNNDILMSVRAPVGPINIATQHICIGRGLAAIRATDKVDNDYLFYFLLKHESEIVGNVGAVFNSINKTQIGNIQIPIPPLEEQKQIVAILDKAFTAIEKAKANIEKNIVNAKELFQSKLNDIFSQKGDGWEEKSLPELVNKSCSLSYGIVQPGNEFQDGLPVVRPTDMKKKFININNLKRIDPTKAGSYKRTILTGNELLLCVRGDTGVISITNKELKGANVTRGIVPVLFDEDLVRLNFGYYQFISKFLYKQIKEKTYGAALMQINIRDVRQLKLNVPPINVQDELLPKLNTLSDNAETLLSLYLNKMVSLDELKKSILQKAFAGELIQKEVVV